MRIITTILFFSTILISCEKAEMQKVERNLKDCYVKYLYFQDGISLSDYQSFNTDPNSSLNIKFSYSDTGNSITRIDGGFITVPSGSNFQSLLFSDFAYDSININSNSIYVFKKYKVDEIIGEDLNSPQVFKLDSQ